MQDLFSVYNIISGILVAILIILCYIIRNLLIKVEKYEDITVDQASYLQNISNIIRDSQKHLQNLDENGVFQSDDEVGYFFEQMKTVQDEISRFKLPEDYAEKEIKS